MVVLWDTRFLFHREALIYDALLTYEAARQCSAELLCSGFRLSLTSDGPLVDVMFQASLCVPLFHML